MSQLCLVDSLDLSSFASKFFHKLTMLDDKSSCEGSISGTTVWGTPGRAAVMYWSWTLTDQGLVVLSNPLGIRSNLLFSHGAQTLPLERQVLEANKLVHSLDWQAHVLAHLRRLGLAKFANITGERTRHERTKDADRVADRLAA